MASLILISNVSSLISLQHIIPSPSCSSSPPLPLYLAAHLYLHCSRDPDWCSYGTHPLPARGPEMPTGPGHWPEWCELSRREQEDIFKMLKWASHSSSLLSVTQLLVVDLSEDKKETFIVSVSVVATKISAWMFCWLSLTILKFIWSNHFVQVKTVFKKTCPFPDRWWKLHSASEAPDWNTRGTK